MFPVHTKITRKGSGDVTVLFCRSEADRAMPVVSGRAWCTRSARPQGSSDPLTVRVDPGVPRLGRGG
mgnify:CR=1 FL=1